MAEHLSDEQFVRCITDAQRSLYAYIHSLVLTPAEAEDVLQETNLVLWKKRREFQAGTDFRAWAMKVAHFQVLALWKRHQRSRLCFSESLISKLASEGASRADRLDAQSLALQFCSQKLSQEDQHLLRLRYGGELSPAEIARKVQRSADAIYQAMRRIRKSLLACVQRRLASEDFQ